MSIAIGTLTGASTQTIPTQSTPAPHPTTTTTQMYGYGYGGGGMMPGFDVNHIVQIQFAGIMMKLVETMNDKSSSIFSYDKIITFIMLLIITDIKKWLLEFIEFVKKFVTTNIPLCGTTLWEHVQQLRHWRVQWRQPMQLQPPMDEPCLMEPYYEDPCKRVMVNFEMNAYNMNALYQYIIMTPDERIKLGAQYPANTDVNIKADTVMATKIVSKDNISSDVVYKTVDIAITNTLSMSLCNVGFNVNNITGALVGINTVDLTADPMEQTFGNVEDNDIFKWIHPSVDGSVLKKGIVEKFNSLKKNKITLGVFAKNPIWVPSFIYDLLHKNVYIVSHAAWPFKSTVFPVYELFIIYLIHIGDFDKLLKKQPVDLMKLYASLLVLMHISVSIDSFIYTDSKCYIISDVRFNSILITPLKIKSDNEYYNAIIKTIKTAQYGRVCFELYNYVLGYSDNTTLTAPSTPTTKQVLITLSTLQQDQSTPAMYSAFLDFYQKVIMKAPEMIKTAQFTANKAIIVYAISYKKTETTTMVENPEYVEWTEMMQCMSGGGGATAPPPPDTAANNEPQKGNDVVYVEKLTPELIAARVDAYKMKPTKMIKQHTYTTELVCDKVNTIYKNLNSLYLREADKRKITSIVDKFKNRRGFYDDLGIPYKLGIMLYGHPGTGKTSTIKAIASYLEKDIYFVNLKNVRTNAELKGIFDHINEKCNGGVIVFEDMDASCEVIKRRTSNTIGETTVVNIMDDAEKGADQLTLSYLLNLFDGTICRDGTIFAITTNHLENIDPALYRPGRVDIKIEFHKCDHYQIQQIFQHIIGRPLAANILEQIPEFTYAPAEIIFEIMHYGLDDCATDKEIMALFISARAL